LAFNSGCAILSSSILISLKASCLSSSNKKITRIANSKDSKRKKDSQTKKAKKALDIAKSKEQDVDL
jgi:hypothetical protein